MATVSEQPKPPSAQDHPYPPAVLPYPQPYSPPFAPPPPGYPPFFAYPPPADPAHPDGPQSPVPPAPYMMAFAPSGMVYAYPTPQGAAFPPPAAAVPPALVKPKRKQVKMACTNCAAACKRCDETRPCERCVKYGMVTSCIDGQRKERKKGIKRGPYKRKNKAADASAGYSPDSTAGQPPPAGAPPAMPVPPQFPPEGFYPVYYGPPGPFLAHPPDPQQASGPEGPPQQPPPPPLPHHPHVNGQPAILPPYFYTTYPPFPHYPPMFPQPGPPPPPGMAPGPQPPPQQPPPAQPPQTAESPQQAISSSSGTTSAAPGDSAKRNGDSSNHTQPPVSSTASSIDADVPPANPLEEPAPSTTPGAPAKKRTRGAAAKAANGVSGEPKAKRAKATRSAVGGKEKEVQEGAGKDDEADANGSGNESSA